MKRLILAGMAILAPAMVRAEVPLQVFSLPSGLRCVLSENHERALVRLELVTRWEASAEPAVRDGRLGFLVKVLENAGAGPHTLAAFNRAVDEAGLDFVFEGRADAFRWQMVADSRSQEAGFELLAHAVFRPAFDGPQVEAQRQALLKQAGGLALRERALAGFQWTLWEGAALLPPSEGPWLGQVDLQVLQDLHRRLVRPEASTLVIHGDLSLAQAKELALLHLGVWGPSAPAPAAPAPKAAEPAKAPLEPGLVAVLEASPRVELWAGARWTQAAPKPAVQELLAVLLERTFQGRPGNVHLHCSLARTGTEPLLIKASAAEGARAELVPALLDQLARLRAKGFSQQDLDRARLRLRAEAGALPLHPEALLRAVLDGSAGPRRDLEGVALRDINGALAAWLAPEGLRYLLLGADATLLQGAQKAGLGPAEVVRPSS